MDVKFELGGRPLAARVTPDGERFRVALEEANYEAEIEKLTESRFRIRTAGAARTAFVVRAPDGRIHVDVDGETFVLAPAARGRKRAAHDEGPGAGEAEIRPPMPGRVVAVKVAPGDAVERNQAVATVEAMKMQLELTSPIAGRVTEVNAGPGDLVDTARPLVVVVAAPAAE